MALTNTQKQNIIKRSMEIARQWAECNREYNAFKEEYDASAYGSVIQTSDLTAYTPSNGLTAAEWVDGVAAMEAISSAVETNKTNLYKIAQ